MKHWPERGECGAMTMFSQHSHWTKNQSKGYYIVKCEKKKKKLRHIVDTEKQSIIAILSLDINWSFSLRIAFVIVNRSTE